MSTPAVLFLAVMVGLVIFLFVSTTNIVKEEPAPRSRRRVPKSALRSRAGEPAADRLERAAQYTGDRELPFSWMRPGTITGKLTMLAWLNRWWNSGSYMRRRLVVSVLSAALLMGAFAALLVVLE